MKNVLHIDDDEDDLEFFSSSVTDIDSAINCTSINSAKDALEKLISNSLTPDIIFLDLNMPEMNGFQFLEEMKKYLLFSIPIVVLSTSSQKDTIDALIASGCLGYLVKPSSTKELTQLIAPFLNGIKKRSL